MFEKTRLLEVWSLFLAKWHGRSGSGNGDASGSLFVDIVVGIDGNEKAEDELAKVVAGEACEKVAN